MALVTYFDLELYQTDIKTAFLNDDIDETIYMVQLENFVSGDSKQMVYKLKRSILGLSKLLVNGITNFIKLSSRLILR